MKDNLILIGMPGAGKSTIGVILAKTLAMDFVDGDLEICKETGTTLQDILDHQGKDAFLEIENRVICGLNPHHTVVATGGSVPLEPEAMGHMKEIGTVIYLKVGLEELRNRLSNIKTRGIAFGPGESLDTLYAQRVPTYESWAEITIEADPNRNDIENMVDQIVAELERRKTC